MVATALVSLRTFARLLIGVMLLAAIAACGGGGGGGSAPPPVRLTLSNVGVPSVDQEVFEGNDPIQPVNVTADVTGDLASLNGATVYVVVEDAQQLFASTAQVTLVRSGLGNTLTISGRSQNAQVGDFNGSLVVNVCLDLACTKPFQGSPVRIPYHVRVLPGLRFTQSGPMVLAAQFPVGAPPTTTNVVMPAGASTFTAALGHDYTNLVDGQMLAAMNVSNQTITVTGRSAPVKSYQFRLDVSAAAVNSRGRVVQLTASRDIVYNVTGPAGLEVVYNPDPLTFTLAYGVSIASNEVVVQTMASTGQVYFYPRRIDYLPAGASGNLDAQGVPWLSVSPSGDTGRSMTNFFGGQMALVTVSCGASTVLYFGYLCLAPGRYEALVYPSSSSQQENLTPLKVSLTVNAP